MKIAGKTLKDYLEFYSNFGITEFEIVEQYITNNHLETEFSNMIIKLTANNLTKEREKLSRASEMVCSISNYQNKHNPKYTNEENYFLDKLIINLAFRPEECLERFRKEIIERVPKMFTPDWCWVDVVALINDKFKVRFKDQDKDYEFINGNYKKYY